MENDRIAASGAGDSPPVEKNLTDQGAANVDADIYEAKRLAARRRFLLGGAAALPLVVTLGQKEAWAASAAVCRSRGVFTRDLTYQDPQKGFQVSMFCRLGG